MCTQEIIMTVGDACPIENAVFWQFLNELFELVKFTSSADIEEVLLVIAVMWWLFAILHCCN